MSPLLDAQYALRRFKSAPGFTAIAALTLALGIGATTAIYSVVDALMLKPLPYGDPARLADLGTQGRTGVRRYFDGNQLATLKGRTDLFASVDAYNFAGTVLLGAEGSAQIAAMVVGGELFATLGVRPQLGRVIDAADVRERRAVIVLGDRIWRSQFGADPTIIGRAIGLDDKTVEVVGVMPPSFKFPGVAQQVWMPLDLSSPIGRRPLFLIARLPHDRPIVEARARIEGSTVDVPNAQGTPVATPLRIAPSLGTFLNAPVRTAILLLAGAVTLVLLIACANIANLLMVQNAGRYSEIAVRVALGASRAALVRQFLIESALLSAAGGLLGLIAAQWFIDIFATNAPQDSGINGVNPFGLDARVIAFAVAATMLTGCLSGILPAIRGSRAASYDALRSGGRSATDGPKQERLRNMFVVLQLAVSVVLLVGATLLARTFLQLTRVDPGFDPRGLASAQIELPSWRYRTPSARQQFFETLAERTRALPGVSGTALSSGGLRFGLTFEVEGAGVVLEEPRMEVPFSSVSANYFSVMRIPIKAGRSFTAEDVVGAPPAIVISQALASRLWKDRNPIGQRFRMSTRPTEPWYTVVGVVGDVYQNDYSETSNQPAYYVPIAQAGMSSVMTMVARTESDASSLLPMIRDQVNGIDPAQGIWRLRTAATELAEFLAMPRFYTLLMGGLAGFGVVIAAVGLYGVLAYAISQRTREFGVRLALGAQKADVLGLVLRSGGIVTALGLGAGIAGSVFATRWIESMLIDVPRIDPISYAAATLLFALVALAACWIPARRATNVDPIVALRYE
jgi:putative ABC transport system permease protein